MSASIPSPSVSDVVRAASKRSGFAAMELPGEGLFLTWESEPPTIDPPDWRVALRALLRPGQDRWHGGVVGWLGYESGCVLDRQPTHPWNGILPTVALWRWSAGLRLLPSGRWEPVGSAAGRREAAELLAGPCESFTHTRRCPPSPIPDPPPGQGPIYRSAVRTALDRIARGDVYQVCLSWPQRIARPVDPIDAWLLLRRDNPAARAALFRLGDRWLLSNSPETFVDVEPAEGGLRAQSVPIKGTVPVTTGPEGRQWLLDSKKEKAELTMIVDLVRNDLGRVARAGMVSTGSRLLRRCGDLWHAEQAVTAVLRPTCDAVDAIAAAFPPGSVTGAPKIKAMELIHELEAGARGPYTGVLGLWSDDGAARTSVLIRTASITPDAALYHVGAGIVADSDPEREWQETRAKGTALGTALMAAGTP